MGFCIRCGHELGLSRFCTNCGHPVAGDPVPPSGPRFPLYADEVASTPSKAPARSEAPAPSEPPTAVLPAVQPAGQPDEQPAVRPASTTPPWRGTLRWLPFAALGLVMVLLLWGGIWLLAGGDGPNEASGAPVTPPDEVTELASAATPRVPATAPPNQSLGGALVDYRARNMLDEDPATAWRMPGDGTGEVLRFELDRDAVVTTVGLVNGYAKTDTDPQGRPVRWYRHNRRIEQVTWIFDDGTEVVQRLETTPDLQTVDIDPVRSTTVRLRLDAVSAPGTTDRARNFTPISEVTLQGGPAD